MIWPTWIFYRIYRPFLPKGHPWIQPIIPLGVWAATSKDLNYELSMGLWQGLVWTAFAIAMLIMRGIA